MAYTQAMEPSRPADTNESPSLGASVIRNLKSALIERLNSWVFGFDSAGTEVDTGVKFLPCVTQTAQPSTAANKVSLFAKDVNSKAELHIVDEDGDVVKITEAGGVAINGEYVEKTALNVYRATASGFIVGALNEITVSGDEAQTVETVTIPAGTAIVKAGRYYLVAGNVGDKYYFIAH